MGGTELIAQTLSRFWPVAGQEPAPAGTWSPDVDAVERRDTFIARVDLPGTPVSDIHVEMSQDEITVFGQRPREVRERSDSWSHDERPYGWFFRIITLPAGAWPGGATAVLRDGVLEIGVPLTMPDSATEPASRKTNIPVRRA